MANTHHREHDHHGDDLATNVVLETAIGSFAAGTSVQSVLEAIVASLAPRREFPSDVLTTTESVSRVANKTRTASDSPGVVSDSIRRIWNVTASDSPGVISESVDGTVIPP